MPDDLRRLMQYAARKERPSIDVNRLQRRGQMRRWLRRSLSGASVLLLGLASWAVAGQLTDDSSTDVAGGGGSGYAISDVHIAGVNGDVADVRFSIGWAGDRFPGFRPCTVTVFNSDGNTVGEKSLKKVSNEKPAPDSLSADVPVTGSAHSAEVRCHERLDDPNGQYQISDITVERPSQDSSEILMAFRYRWVGSGMPGLAECHIEVLDDGQVVVEDDTTFRSEAEEGATERSMTAPADYEGQPSEATVECVPFE